MIINSQFKDYYDYVAHQYRDEKVVYERKTIVVDFEKTHQFNDLLNFSERYTWGFRSWTAGNKLDTRSDDMNLLIVGGKVYPFTTRRYSNNTEYYDFKTPYTKYEEEENKKQPKWLNRYNNSKSYFLRHHEKVEIGARMNKAVELCQNYAPIILIWGETRRDFDNQRNVRHIILDPNIKELKPPIDAWTLVQDIMGVLNSVEPNIPTMSNENKIDSHGYDKYSFRPNMKKGK
jgi:hypothetical protein